MAFTPIDYSMYSSVAYTGDGTTKDFIVPFPYLYTEDVHVTVNGTEATVYPVVSHDNPPSPFDAHWYADNLIRFMSAPEGQVKIYRETNRATPEVEFTNSAILTEEDLNTVVTQLMYIVQESYDNFINMYYQLTASKDSAIASADRAEEALQNTILAGDEIINKAKEEVGDIADRAEEVLETIEDDATYIRKYVQDIPVVKSSFAEVEAEDRDGLFWVPSAFGEPDIGTIEQIKQNEKDVAEVKNSLDGKADKGDLTQINDALSQFKTATNQRLENIENLPPDLVTSINAYYAMRRTGKVYQTKLWKFSTNTSPAGVKLLDNADLVCQPSTDTVEGRDDYADIPLFQWVNVNYIREADGTPVPVAIEGQPGYKTEGAVDVGAMQMSFWWNWEDFEEYSLVTISDTPHPELGLKPWPECVRADGSVTEYCIGSKYMAGLASDGLYRSQPNIPLWNKTCSYNTLVTQMQKKGAGYWGAGIAHWSFAPVMLAIKYGTKNSQSVMQGCYGYSVTSYASQAENGVKRVIVPNANYVVGSYIQIGSATTDVGRSNAAGYDIIDHARIASIESAGAGLYALNLDINKTINIPSGAVVYSTPYNGGDTDTVIGRHDGSRLSNTDSKHPFRIQGREYAVGAYNISADVAMFNTANCDKEVFWAKRGVVHSSADATIRATYKKIGELFGNAGTDYWVGDITMDTESGALLQVAPIGSSNATGWCDRFYAGGTATTGSREFLQGGLLGSGSSSGSCFLYCGDWLGAAVWSFAARD